MLSLRETHIAKQPSKNDRHKRARLLFILSGILSLFLMIQVRTSTRDDRRLQNHSGMPSSVIVAVSEPAVTAQVFLPWKNATTHPIPCIIDPFKSYIHEPKGQPSTDGLLFVRIPKTGSSTVCGVAARIAHSLGRSTLSNGTTREGACQLRMSHEWSRTLKSTLGGLQARDKTRSFLWTILRDPSKRAQSSFFFFKVGREGVNATEENVVNFLKYTSNYQLRYIATETTIELLTMKPNELSHVIQGVLNEFNFMGTLERLDESLVLLQLMLDLKSSDVLYQSAKQSDSGYDYLRCTKIVKGFTTPAIQEYLSSDKWMHLNEGDYLLYDAVHRSLDRTIDYIG